MVQRKGSGLVTGGFPVQIRGWITGWGAAEQGTKSSLVPGQSSCSYACVAVSPLQ